MQKNHTNDYEKKLVLIDYKQMRLKNIRIWLYGVALTTLAGCAGAPVGWGGTHQVTLANEQAISIVYDPLMGGYGYANAEATAHCMRYKKNPVPTNKVKNGVLTEQVFECR